LANSTTGPANGVVGETSSTSGWAVYRNSRANSGTTFGVVGDTSSPSGSALVGRSFGTGDLVQLISSVAGGNPKLRITASGDFISLGNINATNGFRTAVGTVSVGGTPAAPAFLANGSGNVITTGTVAVGSLGSGGATPLCRNDVSNQISTCSSSAKYKSNISTLNSGLDLVRKLRPVSFNWKNNGMADLGLVAEEVIGVEPLLATTNSSGAVEGVKYDRVSVVLINAIKEQQDQIEKQQALIERQQSQLVRLEKFVRRLEGSNRRHRQAGR
jgi:hypothetical protein